MTKYKRQGMRVQKGSRMAGDGKEGATTTGTLGGGGWQGVIKTRWQVGDNAHIPHLMADEWCVCVCA